MRHHLPRLDFNVFEGRKITADTWVLIKHTPSNAESDAILLTITFNERVPSEFTGDGDRRSFSLLLLHSILQCLDFCHCRKIQLQILWIKTVKIIDLSSKMIRFYLPRSLFDRVTHRLQRHVDVWLGSALYYQSSPVKVKWQLEWLHTTAEGRQIHFITLRLQKKRAISFTGEYENHYLLT